MSLDQHNTMHQWRKVTLTWRGQPIAKARYCIIDRCTAVEVTQEIILGEGR